jgi:predicted dehydrogenase
MRRIVVYGGGYWGQNYIRELGRHCALVVDPDPVAQAQVKARFGVPTAPELPEGFDLDGAIVCTPPQNHYEVALPLLEAGLDVLIEKPMATNTRHAEELATFPNCMAGLVYLYHPSVEGLREVALSQGLCHLYARRTNDGPVRPYKNALWDLAPHDISIFNFVMGGLPGPVAVTSITQHWAFFTLGYPQAPATAYVSWHGGPKVRRIELVPERGQRVVFDDLAVVLEERPLTRMVSAFLSGNWDRCHGLDGADVVKIVERLDAWE